MPFTDWERRRATLVDADKVLLSPTHLWLRRIPVYCQPKQLCRYYPRIANAIANSWDEPMFGDRLLTELLVDRRGSRAGFTARIVEELNTLQRLRVRASRKAHVNDIMRQALSGVFRR